jgi:hypothetical protein
MELEIRIQIQSEYRKGEDRWKDLRMSEDIRTDIKVTEQAELLGFWTSSIVRYSKNCKTQRFGN